MNPHRYADLSVGKRTILTPGPVEVDPRVLRAMATPILGQFDPEFTSLMNETSLMIRDVFRTTVLSPCAPVSGPSRALPRARHRGFQIGKPGVAPRIGSRPAGGALCTGPAGPSARP